MRAAPIQFRAGRTEFVLTRCATRALVLGILFLHALPAEPAAAAKAVVLQIDGAIGPAVADYVARELRGISPIDTRLVVLRMNTPGGLDTSMREIIRAILSSPVPVAAYVAPSGARAASAGTYITYASAIAAMAPGTNLGAATWAARRACQAAHRNRKIRRKVVAVIPVPASRRIRRPAKRSMMPSPISAAWPSSTGATQIGQPKRSAPR
jgi:membrane-bound ClpP family serine protease